MTQRKGENRITIRVSDFENGLIRSHANNKGISVSDFVRSTLKDAIENEVLTQMYLESYSRHNENEKITVTASQLMERFSTK